LKSSIHGDESEMPLEELDGFYQQLLARIEALPGSGIAGATLRCQLKDAFGTLALKSTVARLGDYLKQPQADHALSQQLF